ncbi:hypothetical protein B0A50_08148 [Salinomyces thailandicus]|uniref:Uncharacterized protein n=1 Tax=Salinomyces thailandicus TaxID=706561 RepID=A0A4U0TKY0_9PEZI|nr:hypothetical protein B0A50_08148 [Salinomyces thailandica]
MATATQPSTSFTSAKPPSAAPPRIDLDADATHFDLRYDPRSFETQVSRAPTAEGENLRALDRPTLGAVDVEASTAGRRETGGLGTTTALAGLAGTEREEDESWRQHRFVEGIADSGKAAQGSGSTTGEGASSYRRGSPDLRDNLGESSSLQTHTVNPATIPVRTSSSKAVPTTNGEREKRRHSQQSTGTSVTSPKRSPTKQRSLGSVPEESRRGSGQAVQQKMRGEEVGRSLPRYPPQLMNGSAPGSISSGEGREAGSTASTYQPTGLPPSAATYNDDTLGDGDQDPQQPPTDDPLATSPTHNWTTEKENILRGPYNYLESHPGKDIRTQLITAFNAWLRVPPTSLQTITTVIGMLHTASLLIDDVEDSSSLRRGIPVAHHIFGPAQTINSANYIYFQALQHLVTLHNPSAIQIYTDELCNLHRGQGMDLFWRDTLTCPTEADYLEMVSNKTGGLFRLAIKLLCAESPSHQLYLHQTTPTDPPPPDYLPLANTIGLLFQILDDYLNLASPTYTSHKGLAEDLTEGKFSFPIIHSIRQDPSNLVLLNVLREKTKDEEVKRFAVGYMEGTGSLAYTRRVLRGLERRAGEAVGVLEAVVGAEGGVGVRGILEGLRVARGKGGGGGKE